MAEIDADPGLTGVPGLAVTPFAGMASFLRGSGALGFPKQAAAVMPFEYRSPKAIAPEQTLLAFISAVVVGASRFAHAGWLRHEEAFHALLGVKMFRGEDAISRFFHQFTQARTEAFWCPLWKWMLELMEAPKLLPAGMRIRCVRADSGFFDQKLLGFLEQLWLS